MLLLLLLLLPLFFVRFYIIRMCVDLKRLYLLDFVSHIVAVVTNKTKPMTVPEYYIRATCSIVLFSRFTSHLKLPHSKLVGRMRT